MQRNVETSAIFFKAFSSVIRNFTSSSSHMLRSPKCFRFVADAE